MTYGDALRKGRIAQMTTDRMIELLEIEHECMLRGSHDVCDRNCADCELVQDDDELHEMYTNVIALLKEQEEQKRRWLQSIADNQLANSPNGYEDDMELKYISGIWNGLQMAWEILTEEKERAK